LLTGVMGRYSDNPVTNFNAAQGRASTTYGLLPIFCA
jgi:hypothetical protein